MTHEKQVEIDNTITTMHSLTWMYKVEIMEACERLHFVIADRYWMRASPALGSSLTCHTFGPVKMAVAANYACLCSARPSPS